MSFGQNAIQFKEILKQSAGRLVRSASALKSEVKEGFEGSIHLAHTTTVLFAFVTEVLKKEFAHGTTWLAIISLSLAGLSWVAAKFRVLQAKLCRTLGSFFILTATACLVMLALDAIVGGKDHDAMAGIPGIEELRRSLGDIRNRLADESKLNVARHAEIMAGQKRLEALFLDAASGGAPAIKVTAAIRDLLRPGNPEIDAVPAEQLPNLVNPTSPTGGVLGR